MSVIRIQTDHARRGWVFIWTDAATCVLGVGVLSSSLVGVNTAVSVALGVVFGLCVIASGATWIVRGWRGRFTGAAEQVDVLHRGLHRWWRFHFLPSWRWWMSLGPVRRPRRW